MTLGPGVVWKNLTPDVKKNPELHDYGSGAGGILSLGVALLTAPVKSHYLYPRFPSFMYYLKVVPLL